MKVLDIKTKSTIDVNNSYGARLIEQGRAVLVPVKKAETKKETSDAQTVAAADKKAETKRKASATQTVAAADDRECDA